MIPLNQILPPHALNSDVAIATVRTSVNRENINLLLFFEPQQIAKFSITEGGRENPGNEVAMLPAHCLFSNREGLGTSL